MSQPTNLTLYQRPEWSLSVVYRPHYDLAVAVLDEALEPGDAAKVRSFDDPKHYSQDDLRDSEHLSDQVDQVDRVDARTLPLPLITLTRADQWREPLKRAYREDPERLSLHGLALRSASLSDLIAQLNHIARASGEARPVIVALREALTLEARALMQTWEVSESPLDINSEESSEEDSEVSSEASFEMRWRAQLAREPSLDDVMPPSEYSPLLRDLQRCRRTLFEGDPPPLTLIHCPALKRSGRGASSAHQPQGRVIAISLDQPSSWAFCQAFHEEVHAITDLHHRGSISGALSRRDTRLGEAGSDLHRTLEQSAIKRATELIKARCPQRARDDLEWRRAHGLSTIETTVETTVKAGVERVQGAQELLSQLSAPRRRLVTLFIGALVSAWSGVLLSRALGVALSLTWVLIIGALCYSSKIDETRLGALLARRRVALGVHDLNDRQRLALIVSVALQALTISLI